MFTKIETKITLSFFFNETTFYLWFELFIIRTDFLGIMLITYSIVSSFFLWRA
jgi:hypothetical protein